MRTDVFVAYEIWQNHAAHDQHRFLFYILNLCELRNNRLEKREERKKKSKNRGC